MMRNSSPLQFILPLYSSEHYRKHITGKQIPEKPTFSFKCNTSTIIASTTVPSTTVNVTHGIHRPGRKNSSLLHGSPSRADGSITSFEFGITPSMLMKCCSVWTVAPTKRFSM